MKKLWLNDILETERCILRIPEESEAEYIWNLITEKTTQYMVWSKWDTPEATIRNIKKTISASKEWTWWEAAIYNKTNWICIGRCGINRIDTSIPLFELGYWIHEDYYGKGIIPECVNRYLQYAFKESNFEKVVIRCDSRNINSQKVALKCWMKLEWEFKRHEKVQWELRDTKFFWILKEEYLWKKK